jgi:hypothetical protein
MSTWIDPGTVLSPRALVSDLNVIYDGGLLEEKKMWSGWALAKMLWDGSPAVGVRWNGEVDGSVGSPQSRGLPTWFILPEPLAETALKVVEEHLRSGDDAAPEALPPRRRLLDLIAFVRAASDEELSAMINAMALRPVSGS